MSSSAVIHARVSDVRSAHILVLGLGNDILTDDAVGLRVAEALSERLAHRKDICVSQSSEAGLALLDLVVGFDQLVIVDAIQTGNSPPGFVHELEIGQIPSSSSSTISPHFMGLAELFAFGLELGLAIPTRVKIFAVEVEDPFTIATRMTPAVNACLPRIIETLRAFCESLCP